MAVSVFVNVMTSFVAVAVAVEGKVVSVMKPNVVFVVGTSF
jgi:hypothetical protein